MAHPGRREILAHAAFAGLLAAAGRGAQAQTAPSEFVLAANIDNLGSLDWAFDQSSFGMIVSQATYGFLARRDAERPAEFRPDLATGWDVSDRGRRWTFALRRDLRFASGNPMTAEDVAWSYRRAVSVTGFRAGQLSRIGLTTANAQETIEVLDPATVRFTLDRSYAAPVALANLLEYIGIVDSALVRQNAAGSDWGRAFLTRRTAGTGPYGVTRWDANSLLILEPTQAGAGAAPLRRIVVRHVAESSVQRLLLERGDVDAALNLTPDDRRALVGTNRPGRFVRGPVSIIGHMAMNAARPPFDKPPARRALRNLVDYAAVTALGGGFIDQMHTPITPGALPGLGGRPFAFDPRRARALLDEAGVRRGAAFDLAAPRVLILPELLESMQENAREIGLRLNLTFEGESTLYARWRVRDFTLIAGLTSPADIDPDGNVTNFMWNPDNTDPRFNVGRAWRSEYSNPEATRLVEEGRVESDPTRRAAIYARLEQIYIDEAPFVILFGAFGGLVVSDRITGIAVTRSVDLSGVRKTG